MHELVSALSGQNEIIFHHIHSMTILCNNRNKQDVKCTSVQIQANCAIRKYIALLLPMLYKWNVHIGILYSNTQMYRKCNRYSIEQGANYDV